MKLIVEMMIWVLLETVEYKVVITGEVLEMILILSFHHLSTQVMLALKKMVVKMPMMRLGLEKMVVN